jgi:acetyl esterase/lipase
MSLHPILKAASAAALAALCLAGNVQAQALFATADAKVAPTADKFYTPPSQATLNSAMPGTVLRYRPIPNTAYSSTVSEAYQLMFRTTDGHDKPVAAITTVLIPKNAPATGRKLFSYHSFYDSLTLNCTPSYLTVKGSLFEENYVEPALKKGIVVVLTDYEGLQSQWIAGLNTAHTALDGMRAAIKFPKTKLTSSAQIGMMGFSGGGHATAWTAEVAPEYAPELNIVGAAMGGVPANIDNVARKVDGTLFAGVYLEAVVGLSRAYPEIDPAKYATPAGLTAIKDIGQRCLLGIFEGQKEVLVKYAFTKSTKYLKDADFLNLPEIKPIIQENNLGSRTPQVPVYVYEGTNDEIMPIADVDSLVQNYCSKGVKVQYNRTSGDHLLMAIAPSNAMSYVLDRMDGRAAPTNCK